MAGAFLICPCHLPLTMAFATTVLAGTTAGVFGPRGAGGVVHAGVAAVPRRAGTVRVIRDLAHAERLQPSEILVTLVTTPAWTPSFRIAAGVVADIGNAMSHTSIVAREYGIPAVVGCGDATARLKDGERVTVDGAAGTVTHAHS